MLKTGIQTHHAAFCGSVNRFWFCKRQTAAPWLKISSGKRYLESQKAKLRLSGQNTTARLSVEEATDLDVLLGHRRVFGVLQELSHVGHDGLLVRVPNVHICTHITILHEASHNYSSTVSRWGFKTGERLRPLMD